MTKKAKTIIITAGCAVAVSAIISAVKLTKLVRDLNQIQLDLDLCDGDWCSSCPEQRRCEAIASEEE